MPQVTGMPPVTVNRVTVADEYNMSTQTRADMIDPAWSEELNQVPFYLFLNIIWFDLIWYSKEK